jgi:hypothetical protein
VAYKEFVMTQRLRGSRKTEAMGIAAMGFASDRVEDTLLVFGLLEAVSAGTEWAADCFAALGDDVRGGEGSVCERY